MTRYYFHQHEPGFDAFDEEGALFASDSAAMDGGNRAARQLAAGAVEEGQLIEDEHVDVVVEGGRLVGTVFWRDVIRLRSSQVAVC